MRCALEANNDDIGTLKDHAVADPLADSIPELSNRTVRFSQSSFALCPLTLFVLGLPRGK
jgi:hypothetical protein